MELYPWLRVNLNCGCVGSRLSPPVYLAKTHYDSPFNARMMPSWHRRNPIGGSSIELRWLGHIYIPHQIQCTIATAIIIIRCAMHTRFCRSTTPRSHINCAMAGDVGEARMDASKCVGGDNHLSYNLKYLIWSN